MRNYLLLIFIFLLVNSCQQREWLNPFDPDCPKELFSPDSFGAALSGNQVNLSWKQANTNISGYEIERSVAGGNWTLVATPGKSSSLWSVWSDTNLSVGKVHSYRLVAKAGSNASNPITIQITPLFSSTLATNPVSKLLSTSAVLGGTITNDGGATVTARGVCWSTSSFPTINNSKTSDGSGTGTYTSSITGLATNSTYYVRAYATNSQGTSYGNEIAFKTYFGEVTDIDGNVYPTVKIGNQIWMAENLKVTRYNDGTAIPNVTDNTQWAGLTTGANCWYNNDVNNKNVYGALYNWYAVNTNKLAPVGWHVPTDAEWTTLTDYLGGISVAGGKLKETGTIHWLSPNTGATNESGFNALPGGFRGGDQGINGDLKINGYWWTLTNAGSAYAYDFYINNNSTIGKYYPLKGNGCSVRCILGTLSLPTITTNSISEITFESAVLGGNVTNDGNSTVTERGVVYSTSPNPTTANTKVLIGSGTGSFSSKVTGLSNNITYYVRAFATNSLGTTYGSEQTFTLYMNVPGPNVTDVDGNIYKTVKIGNQIWMAENLKVTKYRNGNTIQNVTDGAAWANLVSGAYCDFTNNVNFGTTYGHLYNYFTVVDSRQISPEGYHVPSATEWKILTDYMGGEELAGGKLKETGTIHWASPNTGADNSSGFTAFAGSWRGDDGSFYYWVGNSGSWWSTTQYDSNNGVYLSMAYNQNLASQHHGAYFGKKGGCSIRCIKD